MITEEEILSLKSQSVKDILLMICDDVSFTDDFIGQITRIHVWIDKFIDGIIFQINEKSKKTPNTFTQKLDYVFKLGIIDTEHYEHLKILMELEICMHIKFIPMIKQ